MVGCDYNAFDYRRALVGKIEGDTNAGDGWPPLASDAAPYFRNIISQTWGQGAFAQNNRWPGGAFDRGRRSRSGERR